MQILRRLGEQTELIVLVLVISVLSMVVYALTSPEPNSSKFKSMLAGGIIAMVLSYPTWLAIGEFNKEPIAVFYLVPITFAYTITSQFIPDALRLIVPKLFNSLIGRFYKSKTGEDLK